MPSVPHVATGVVAHAPWTGGVPGALGAHVPSPFRLHAWQVPHVDVEQQTPSTQLPVAHARPFVPQAAPAGSTGMHACPLQKKPLVQSALVAQAFAHVSLPPGHR